MLNSLGEIARCLKDYRQAHILYLECYENTNEFGSDYLKAVALYNLGCV